VTYAASTWRFDDVGGVLSGPGIELPARIVFDEGDLRIYALEGNAR
jgi:hypothetical protein